jgi:repressor LexA
MSRRHLTSKQHAFLEFLRSHVESHKIWPTYREIVEHFDYRSPNSVTQNLQALSRKGFLQRDRNGYQLVDRSGRDGTVALVGTIHPGRFDRSDARFSLADIVGDVTSLRAVRVSADVTAEGALAAATHILVTEGDPEADETALVLAGDRLSLAAAYDVPPGALVLGRYAGHAGPHGLAMDAHAHDRAHRRPTVAA